MDFDYKVLKSYLKNVYFINGSAYAGKSTVCKALAKKYNMILCEENYRFDDFLAHTEIDTHPNMNYFKTMKNWEEFVSRSKEDYTEWMDNVSLELAPFEIIELISLSREENVIVDTNIPHNILKEIATEGQVVYMVATQEIAMNEFFNREDSEKQFLLRVISNMPNSEEALEHFKTVIAYANSEERIEVFKNTDFPFVKRKTLDESIEDKIETIEKLFRLNSKNLNGKTV